jgi:hypothetical protein
MTAGLAVTSVFAALVRRSAVIGHLGNQGDNPLYRSALGTECRGAPEEYAPQIYLVDQAELAQVGAPVAVALDRSQSMSEPISSALLRDILFLLRATRASRLTFGERASLAKST